MGPEVLRYSAFTREGEGGNPAGVVLNADCLTDAQMLSIAQAIKYSETAFVSTPADSAGLQIRFFSPVAEVAFCGHATVATSVAIAERRGAGELHFHTKSGPVTVVTDVSDASVTATLTSPPASSQPARPDLIVRALKALRLGEDDLDPKYPVHVAFAGNHHLIVGVREEATLAGLTYDFPALAELMAEQLWTTVHLFYEDSADRFQARNAFPPGGVVEDPATGAAAAAFGGYLRALSSTDVERAFTILQGHHMGAPSELRVLLRQETASVEVAGSATKLALSPYDDLDAV